MGQNIDILKEISSDDDDDEDESNNERKVDEIFHLKWILSLSFFSWITTTIKKRNSALGWISFFFCCLHMKHGRLIKYTHTHQFNLWDKKNSISFCTFINITSSLSKMDGNKNKTKKPTHTHRKGHKKRKTNFKKGWHHHQQQQQQQTKLKKI